MPAKHISRWIPVLLAIALVGCSLRNRTGLFSEMPRPAQTNVTVNDTSDRLADASMQSPLSPEASVQMPQATSPIADSAYPRRQTWGSRLRNMAAGTRDAMRIEPRVIPAEDPIELGTRPPELGANVFVSAAKVYENQGKEAAAIEQYEKALAAEANSLDALVGLGRLHHRNGRLDKATRLYQEAIQAHPESAVAMNDLALCYARRGMNANAIDALSRAVELQPKSKRYRNNLANVLVDSGRGSEALPHLIAAHGEAIGNYNMGYLLYQKGDNRAAAAHFAKAADMDSSLEAARLMLAKVQPQPTQPSRPLVRTQTPHPGQPVSLPRRPAYDEQNTTPPAAATPTPSHTTIEATISDRYPPVERDTVASGPELERMPAAAAWADAPAPGDMPSYLQRNQQPVAPSPNLNNPFYQ